MKQAPHPEATISVRIQNNIIGAVAIVYLVATPDEWRELIGRPLPVFLGQRYQESAGYNTYIYEWIGDKE